MGSEASLTMLGSVTGEVMTLVNVFVSVYSLLIFLYVLSSWIPLPYNRTLNQVRRFLSDACDPYLRLFRRVLPSLGGIDLSPIVAVVVLWLADRLVFEVLSQF
ncbi:MAG: YggT family protein [Gaiellaceae bacterium]